MIVCPGQRRPDDMGQDGVGSFSFVFVFQELDIWRFVSWEPTVRFGSWFKAVRFGFSFVLCTGHAFLIFPEVEKSKKHFLGWLEALDCMQRELGWLTDKKQQLLDWKRWFSQM